MRKKEWWLGVTPCDNMRKKILERNQTYQNPS